MRLHCFLKAHPTGKRALYKPSSISRRHFKHYKTHCHPLSALVPWTWLLPGLGWKRSWYAGAENQLSLGSLQADGGQERPPKTAAKSHSYVLHPAGGAGPTQPCSAPEMKERQPGPEQRQQQAPRVTELPCGGTVPSLEPSHTGWGCSTAEPEPAHLLWGHHEHRRSCFGLNVSEWQELNKSPPCREAADGARHRRSQWAECLECHHPQPLQGWHGCSEGGDRTAGGMQR